MELPFYQADAFADAVFKGNPAAVVPLKEWLPDDVLFAITRENNLSETAFFVPAKDGLELRWFTVLEEIDLCGHATLAAAHVLYAHLGFSAPHVLFRTRKAGDLRVARAGDLYSMDFPSRPPAPLEDYPPELLQGLGGARPREVLMARDYVVVFEDEETIRHIAPNYQIMERLNKPGRPARVSVTAPGRTADFVSRFFCPGDAMPEDPVTGSAHCHLIPYWAARLGKTDMRAFQVSPRGGALACRLDGDRVHIAGSAVTYLTGTIFI